MLRSPPRVQSGERFVFTALFEKNDKRAGCFFRGASLRGNGGEYGLFFAARVFGKRIQACVKKTGKSGSDFSQNPTKKRKKRFDFPFRT